MHFIQKNSSGTNYNNNLGNGWLKLLKYTTISSALIGGVTLSFVGLYKNTTNNDVSLLLKEFDVNAPIITSLASKLDSVPIFYSEVFGAVTLGVTLGLLAATKAKPS